MFFQRKEIKLFFGCFLAMFPEFFERIENNEWEWLGALRDYYLDCVQFFNDEILVHKKDHMDLLKFITTCGARHTSLQKNTDYAFAGLFYQLLEFAPFRNYLGADIDSGVIDLRPSRNLAALSQLLTKFEFLHRVEVFTSKNIENALKDFFLKYIRFLYTGGIGEYEDDSEYAPSGCVSFLTIHQSKGMEFPIVIVGSLITWSHYFELLKCDDQMELQISCLQPAINCICQRKKNCRHNLIYFWQGKNNVRISVNRIQRILVILAISRFLLATGLRGLGKVRTTFSI